MKIEHRLSPGAIDALQETRQMIQKLSERYFGLLGQAKEAETEAVAQQKILQTQIAMVQRLEKLPESRIPYQLSGDGTALLGDSLEPATPEPAGKPEVGPRMTNGSGAVIETTRGDTDAG